LTVELSLRFGFSATDNQAEYKAIIAGLDLAQDLGARDVQVKTNSQLVVSKVRGDAQVKDALLHKYLATVKKRVDNFVLGKYCTS